MNEEEYDAEFTSIMDEYDEAKDETSTETPSVATDDSQDNTDKPVEVDPEVTPDETPQDETEGTQEEATDVTTEDAPAKEKKPTGGINKKIKKLTKQRREAERERQEARTENARLLARLEALEKSTKPVEPKKTKIEEFDSLEEYQRHLAKEEAAAGINEYKKQQDAQYRYNQELAQIEVEYNKGVDIARKKYEDFDEVVKDFNAQLPLSQKFRRHLASSPAGASTQYMITCNEDVVNRINNARSAAEVEQIVVNVHNELYRELKAPQSASTDNAVGAQPQGAATLTPPTGKNVTVPPKQGKTGESIGDLEDLEGDDFLKEFSKMIN